MTTADGFQFIKNQIAGIYEEAESGNIAELIIEHLTGLRNRAIYYDKKLNAENELLLQQYTSRLLNHEPVQYILQEAWFFGLKFYVDKNVLIPRPETEELVDWMLKEIKNQQLPENKKVKILDIGTGSGCIAIAIKKHLSAAFEVFACDTFEEALTIAQKNAADAGVAVQFSRLDFLNENQRNRLSPVDIIISNPPYVPLKDKESMKEHVVLFEPHTALFVTDKDPLIFYKAIAAFGKSHLNENGAVFAELHEDSGQAVMDLFKSEGFRVTELRKDMQGKERMLKAES